jgi:hypothetical protein
MARRVIDLSQPLSRETQLHPVLSADADPPPHPAHGRGRRTALLRSRDRRHVESRRHPRRRVRPLRPERRRDRRAPARHLLRRRALRRHPAVRARARRHHRRGRAGRPGRRPGAARGRHPALLLRPLQPHRRHARVPGQLLRNLRGGRALDGGSGREDLRRRDDQPGPRLPDGRVPDAQGVRRARADALREPEQPERRCQPALPVPLRLEVAYASPVRAAAILDD